MKKKQPLEIIIANQLFQQRQKMENRQKLHSKPKLQNQMTEIEMTNEIDV